jgi:hypothetical protein
MGVSLPPLQALVLVLFAAMPTASSAYVLAARMGGDGLTWPAWSVCPPYSALFPFRSFSP